MEIATVKFTEFGYLVNGSISVPNDTNNADYQQVQDWIIGGGIVETQFSLNQLKALKISQLKSNRDVSNLRPLTSGQAYEIVESEAHEFEKTTNKVYFAFSLATTSQPATDPSSIILGTIINSLANPSFYLRYSCAIIEGESIRKGYVAIDRAVANEVQLHIANRVQDSIAYANTIEKQLIAATSLEELEAIDITI